MNQFGKWGRWNEKEIEALKLLYSKPVSNENITKILNKTSHAVWYKASDLKLKKKFRNVRLESDWPTTLTANIDAKETDLAWAAGFIEGEGSVRFYVRKDRKYSEAKISACNTKKEYLEFIKSLLGGSVCLSSKKGSNIGKYENDYASNHDVWGWAVYHRLAYRACKAILPYIHGENLKQAKNIVEWHKQRNKEYEWWSNIDNVKTTLVENQIVLG